MTRRSGSHDNEPVAAPPCPFEKAVLSRTCACRHARRGSVGSRQTVCCHAEDGNRDCVGVLNRMRQSANFSLGVVHTPSALPHAKAVKLQCGGLIGLQNALDQVVKNQRVYDIYGLVQRALRRYGSPQGLPQQDMIRSIAAYRK